MKWMAKKVFKYIVMIDKQQAKEYLQNSPSIYMASKTANDFLFGIFQQGLYHERTEPERLQHILEHALQNCKFKFVNNVSQEDQAYALNLLSTPDRKSLLKTVAVTVTSYDEKHELKCSAVMMDDAMKIFDVVAERSYDIHPDDISAYLTNLVNDQNLCVVNMIAMLPCNRALELTIKHTQLWKYPLFTREFLKFLIDTNQIRTLEEIWEATENERYFFYQMKQAIQEYICRSSDEFLNNDMSLDMLGILSKLVTAQYIVPYTQNKRCVRSAIVYYDKDFVDTAEELRRALQIICGSDPPVGKESFNYEGHSETESIKKFKETFGQFLADSVHNSSLWIISIISHGHAGKIHLTYDPNRITTVNAQRYESKPFYSLSENKY